MSNTPRPMAGRLRPWRPLLLLAGGALVVLAALLFLVRPPTSSPATGTPLSPGAASPVLSPSALPASPTPPAAVAAQPSVAPPASSPATPPAPATPSPPVAPTPALLATAAPAAPTTAAPTLPAPTATSAPTPPAPTATSAPTPPAAATTGPPAAPSATQTAAPATPAAAPTVPPTANTTPQPGAPTPLAAPFSPAATLAALAAAQIPARDLYTLTQQIKARTARPLPHSTGGAPRTYRLGDSAVFNVGDAASGSYYTVTATLRAITAHAYWWVAEGNDLDLAALQQSASRFEQKIYPGDRATFGEPPNPGVDNDSRINVLNAPLSGAAGYFSAADMYTQAVNPYSNERKMIYAGVAPGGGAYEGLLAHEFQHMIHWNVHPNQNVWINEGMAELAMKINGYDTGGPEAAFQANPDVQLNDWTSPPSAAIPHYGAAYLFMNYLYDHYGPEVIRAIMQAPGADTDAIDGAFAALGRPERFADVFTAWTLANWLDKAAPDPRYSYPHLQVAVQPRAALPAGAPPHTGTIHQQAADYIPLTGGTAVSFAGESTVPLIGTTAHSGAALWWSNRADVSAPSLTRAFDLHGVARATLSYWTWYDIEEGYDYAYAEVSTDGGQTWATLPGPATTAANPNGNNLGNGYTGHSGGGAVPAWIHEQVDLGPYAGQAILLRFQYITDDGVNWQGFAVDDIRIPEIGFTDDAETPGANGWTAAGFVHVTPVLPERWVVALIRYPPAGAPTVTMMPLDAANRGRLSLAGAVRAVLMVAPLAPATTEPGRYTVTVR